MRRDEIEALANRWMAFWQGASLDDWDAVHAGDFVDRSAAGRGADRSAFRGAVSDLRRAFPDFRATADCIAIDERQQMAAIRWSASGRHLGLFLGVVPTRRDVRFTGIEIIRCRSGQVAERWGEWDEGGITRQLNGLN